MKYFKLVLCVVIFGSCQKDPVVSSTNYACELAFETNSSAHPKSARFEEEMAKIREIVPGVQAAVRSKDGNVWIGAQGMADIPNKVPFENCTKTMVGSVSKIYTAVLIMQLHEEGILSINDPVSKWIENEIVTEISNVNKVNIANLLMHTSGIRDYLGNKIQIDAVNTSNYKLTPREKLKYVYGRSAEFEPNEKYGYSNSNYVLLGLIIEKARNVPYHEAIEKYISMPLGFANTAAGTSENPIPDGTARPYLALHNGNYSDVMEYSVSDAATGDGAIATNMQEALYFIEAISTNTIVTQETKEMMINQKVIVDNKTLFGEKNWYGLGLEQVESKYGLGYGHAGSTSAYWSELFHFPDSGVTIAVAFNGDTEQSKPYAKLLNFIQEILAIAFE